MGLGLGLVPTRDDAAPPNGTLEIREALSLEAVLFARMHQSFLRDYKTRSCMSVQSLACQIGRGSSWSGAHPLCRLVPMARVEVTASASPMYLRSSCQFCD